MTEPIKSIPVKSLELPKEIEDQVQSIANSEGGEDLDTAQEIEKAKALLDKISLGAQRAITQLEAVSANPRRPHSKKRGNISRSLTTHPTPQVADTTLADRIDEANRIARMREERLARRQREIDDMEYERGRRDAENGKPRSENSSSPDYYRGWNEVNDRQAQDRADEQGRAQFSWSKWSKMFGDQ